MTPLRPAEISDLPHFDDWRFVLGAIHGEFTLESFTSAGEFVRRVTAAADAAGHHPDLSVRYPGTVRIRLRTHDADAVTTLDIDLARTISAIAADLGARSEPTRTSAIEIAIDTTDPDRIRPFWAAVLGYREDGRWNLSDPDGIGPPMWFQETEQPRTERQRFHIDISVAHDIAEQRVAAAIAAGGRLVTDRFARSWWVLADADGNEACVCTWLDREA